MRYTDNIAQSKNDTEYAGGEIFKDLVEEGTIVPFDGDVRKQGFQVFTLDKFCYTGKTTQASDTRAYILIDTPYPIQASTIRLILCDGINKATGKQKLLEVLPAPDGEFPIFGNDWMHKLSWFLKAEALGINFYETVISWCQNKKYLNCRYDLRHQEIITPKDRLIYLDEFSDLVSYVNRQVQRGSSRYGCQQRSRKYYGELKRLAEIVQRTASHRSLHWGSKSSDPLVPFKYGETYIACVINFATDIVTTGNITDLEFIMEQFRIIIRVNAVKNPPSLEVIDQESLSTFLKEFLSTYEDYYSNCIFDELSFLDLI